MRLFIVFTYFAPDVARWLRAVKVVQEILGHSQIGVTMDTYSHVLPSMQIEAMNKLDDLFRRSDREENNSGSEELPR